MGGITKHTGHFHCSAVHPLVAGGLTVSFDSFKLDENFVSTTPAMENSKYIPLANGSYIMIANSVRGGSIKFGAVRTNNDASKGDIVKYADDLVKAKSSVGATITIAFEVAGTISTTTFYDCMVKTLVPLQLAGNDEPTYDIEFNYGDWTSI